MADAKVLGLAAELGVEDLYEFLGVSPDASKKEITRAYRKKALKCHPDKNPNNPKAAEQFQKLSKALNFLTDPAAKAAYDKWLRAKDAAKRRHTELNAKRRKLKEELESKESQHVTNMAAEMEAASQMQKEIDRLREDGYRIMKEQEEKLRQEFQDKTATEDVDEDTVPTLKVAWKAKKSDESNGGYSQQLLEDIFSEFGPLHHVLVSTKRKGKALVSFHHPFDAQQAVESAGGLSNNPLTVTWVCGGTSVVGSVGDGGMGEAGSRVGDGDTREASDGVRDARVGGDGVVRDSDYESVTLMRLRQAEERKRLCQQLAHEDTR